MNRRLIARIYVLLAGVLALSFLTACSGALERNVTDDEGYSSSVTFHGNRSAAAFDHASQQKIDGNFGAAAKTLLGVYNDTGAESKYREQALYDLGQLHSNLLNPERDFSVAVQYLEKLLLEFPESELSNDAEKRIEQLQARVN